VRQAYGDVPYHRQPTSIAFTGRLEAAGIAISMDGRGRFMDNIFIERLWRYRLAPKVLGAVEVAAPWGPTSCSDYALVASLRLSAV
jgi:transposase InsO family protein